MVNMIIIPRVFNPTNIIRWKVSCIDTASRNYWGSPVRGKPKQSWCCTAESIQTPNYHVACHYSIQLTMSSVWLTGR